MIILEIIAWIIAISICLPMAVFTLEVLLSLIERRNSADSDQQLSSATCFAMIIPAHDEQSELSKTLESLKPEVEKLEQIIVVADNCTDDTANLARRKGVSVLERHDTCRRGKGYALAAGLEWLAAGLNKPPEVVVFLDADCRPTAGSIRRLAEAAQRHGGPVQAIYLLDTPPDDPKAAISWMAMCFKNLIRPRGLAQLGGPCSITGTGFALPWTLIEAEKFASNHLVEDMALGVDLALAGHPPIRDAGSMVLSPMAPSHDSATTQRTRWEHGHLQILLTQTPRLLAGFIRRWDLRLLLMAIDLAVPPLSLLVLVWIGGIVVVTALGLALGVTGPPVLLGAAGLAMGVSVVAGWFVHARDVVPIRRLLAVPLYVAWKIPIYLGFIVNRQRNWVRTERESTS